MSQVANKSYVIVLGMPKGATSTIYHALSSVGLHVQHAGPESAVSGAGIGQLMLKAFSQKREILAYLGAHYNAFVHLPGAAEFGLNHLKFDFISCHDLLS